MEQLPQGMTSYVTNGAGANVPSEDLGFYFSGMQAPDGGQIEYAAMGTTLPARSLIEVDMSDLTGKWQNHTIPDFVIPRANAQLVWVPVSTQGILLAVGGVINPEEIFDGALTTEQADQSMSESPKFMMSVPVYDIASKTWYLQNTTAHEDYPSQLTAFCSVLAIANDSSSFQIYIYGGYNGVNSDDPPNDDVWILTLPSFTWIRAFTGSPGHGRSWHFCALPYPNLMFVIGGINLDGCVEGGIIQVFNLNTNEFQDYYDPVLTESEYEYKVSSKVYNVIGGNQDGGSTLSANWSDPTLGALFEKKYPKPLTAYYPYSSAQPMTTPSPPSTPGPKPHPWLAPVIGVVTGLTITIFSVLCCCRRRRRANRASAEYEATSIPEEIRGNRVVRWIRGVMPYLHSVPKSNQSVTTTEVDANGARSPLAGYYEGGTKIDNIHWRAPAIMVGSLMAGVCFAIGHHLLYQQFDHQPVASFTQQNWIIRVGTAFAFLVKMSLAIATSAAYVQQFWATLSRKSVRISRVDALFTALKDITVFADVGLWLGNPVLTILAIVTW
jgi:Kelch motif